MFFDLSCQLALYFDLIIVPFALLLHGLTQCLDGTLDSTYYFRLFVERFDGLFLGRNLGIQLVLYRFYVFHCLCLDVCFPIR